MYLNRSQRLFRFAIIDEHLAPDELPIHAATRSDRRVPSNFDLRRQNTTRSSHRRSFPLNVVIEILSARTRTLTTTAFLSLLCTGAAFAETFGGPGTACGSALGTGGGAPVLLRGSQG